MKTLLIVFLSAQAFAHEAGEMSIKVGADQGITEVSEDKGFKLHDAAVKRLKLSFIAIQTSGAHSLPERVIVRTLSETGVYRRRDGFIKRVEADSVTKRDGKATFRAHELKPGDEVLTDGVGFVRIIESTFGAGEEEDAHDDHGDDAKKPEDQHKHDDHGGEHHD